MGEQVCMHSYHLLPALMWSAEVTPRISKLQWESVNLMLSEVLSLQVVIYGKNLYIKLLPDLSRSKFFLWPPTLIIAFLITIQYDLIIIVGILFQDNSKFNKAFICLGQGPSVIFISLTFVIKIFSQFHSMILPTFLAYFLTQFQSTCEV